MVSKTSILFQAHPYPRLRRRRVVVDRVGFFAHKREAIDRVLPQHVLMIIIDGAGWWRRDHMASRPLRGPCAAFLRAGTRYAYAPADTWREYFCTFSSCPPALHGQLPADPWPLRDHVTLDAGLAQLKHLTTVPTRPGTADRLDLLSEELLLACLPAAQLDGPDDPLAEAEAWLRTHLRESIGIDALARQHGFSPATFRRHWLARFGTTPSDHLLRLRMGAACSALSDSEDAIAEIAERCGFPNQRHFATVFRTHHGCTPSAYRRARRQQ